VMSREPPMNIIAMVSLRAPRVTGGIRYAHLLPLRGGRPCRQRAASAGVEADGWGKPGASGEP